MAATTTYGTSLPLLGLRVAPVAASTAFSTALLFQIFTFGSVARIRPPVSEARRVGRGLIHLMSPIIIVDYLVAFANVLTRTGELSPATKRLYWAAVAFRLFFLGLHQTATRVRGAIFDDSKPATELFAALQAHVDRNQWRFWAITLPTWLVSVAGPALYLANY